MSKELSLALVQDPAIASLGALDARMAALAEEYPRTRLFVFPEGHLFEGSGRWGTERSRAHARSLDGELGDGLGGIARKHGVWLIPGSVLELGDDGELYNTMPVFSPGGERAAVYRKIFPWRPGERVRPGTEFVVFDLDGVGTVGLLICYDSWFPEVSRQLAWMGAELLVCAVLTSSNDRARELVLAQANAIANQVFFASLNAAAPTGLGRSLLVDPQGRILEESVGAETTVLSATIDLGEVERTRRNGLSGISRPWSQFEAGDPPILLPVYGGRIDPASWAPKRG